MFCCDDVLIRVFTHVCRALLEKKNHFGTFAARAQRFIKYALDRTRTIYY